MEPDQLDLIPDEREEIPDEIDLTTDTIRRWADVPGGWAGTPEVATALARLQGQHAQKQRDTILELVRAELEARPQEEVFRLPITCNRKTYHKKWKLNPSFARVYAYVLDVAVKFQSANQARDVLQARSWVRTHTPNAAISLTNLLGSGSDTVVLRAALAILGIAGVADTEISDQQLAQMAGANTIDGDPAYQGEAGPGEGKAMTFEEFIASEEDRRATIEEADHILDQLDEDRMNYLEEDREDY